MMFPFARRRCGKRNPLLGIALGLFSALIVAGAALAERRDGSRWPLIAVMAVALVALALVRLIAINRDGDGG